MTVDKTLIRHGGLSYLEIPASDVRRSSAFYAAVLGWRVEEDGPRFQDSAGLLIGRWREGREPVRDERLVPYYYVDDLERAVERVRAHGGEVVGGPRAEGDIRLATARDPAGNLIGLWQAA